MAVFDRASETGRGRWHVRLMSPANVVEFADFFNLDSIEEAFAAAQTAYPGYTVEWAVHEPDRYGTWRLPHPLVD